MPHIIIPNDNTFPNAADYSAEEALDLAQRIYLRAGLTRSLTRLKSRIKNLREPPSTIFDEIQKHDMWSWQTTKTIWRTTYHHLTKNLGTILLPDETHGSSNLGREEQARHEDKVLQAAIYALQNQKSLSIARDILEKNNLWHEPTWRHFKNAMTYYNAPDDVTLRMERIFLANSTYVLREYLKEEKSEPPLKKGFKMLKGNLGQIALFGGLIGGLKELMLLTGNTSLIGTAAVVAVPFLWSQIKEGSLKEGLKKLGAALFSGYIWRHKIDQIKDTTQKTRIAMKILRQDPELMTEEDFAATKIALHSLGQMNRRMAAHPKFILNEYNCVPKLAETLEKTNRQEIELVDEAGEHLNVFFTPSSVNNRPPARIKTKKKEAVIARPQTQSTSKKHPHP